MFKKCKANCQANDNLYLRGDVFYYMVELPRQDGKRRYFIKSLHTKNYYEKSGGIIHYGHEKIIKTRQGIDGQSGVKR